MKETYIVPTHYLAPLHFKGYPHFKTFCINKVFFNNRKARGSEEQTFSSRRMTKEIM